MTIRNFGKTHNGEDVSAITISDGNLTATILTWGAVVQDLRLDGVPYPLVLGLNNMADYEEKSPNFGALVGRFANRIHGGKFPLDGAEYQLDLSKDGKHSLHGGGNGVGFGKRVWEIADYDDTSVVLRLKSADGEGGFPANVDVKVKIEILEGGTLSFDMSATTDAPTLMNLAHHSYFNLDDTADIRGHSVQIDAEHYLPVTDELVPTGAIEPVARGMFDFRELCPMGTYDYDHNFCLSDERADLRPVATVRGASGLEMIVSTTETGIQFYNGAKVDVDASGLEDRRYGNYSGLCLEPQCWPDAPNHVDFPSSILRPGETYQQTSTFRFTA